MKTVLAIAAVALVVCRLQSAAKTVSTPLVAANPGRPTVSTPSTLTPVGYLQFETGILYARDSGEFSTRTGMNQVTKLTVTRRLEFLLQSEPLVGSTGSEHPATRPGEVFAGAPGLIMGGDDGKLTIAVSYIRRLHQSPVPELDIGTFRQSATVLMSDDFWRFHFDANAVSRNKFRNQSDAGNSARLSLSPTPSERRPYRARSGISLNR